MAIKAKHLVKRKSTQKATQPKRVLSALTKKAGKLGKKTTNALKKGGGTQKSG